MPRLPQNPRVLFIQTAFIGDAVLLSSMVRTWRKHRPDSICEVLVRKGNGAMFADHPDVAQVHEWDKSGKGRNRRLWQLLKAIRARNFGVVFNAHRHLSSGVLTAGSGAKFRVGYRANPLSKFFTHRVLHEIGDGRHEAERLVDLLRAVEPNLAPSKPFKPRLFPNPSAVDEAERAIASLDRPFVLLAPGSQWFTKQWPTARWRQLVELLEADGRTVVLFGGPAEAETLRACLPESSSALMITHLSLMSAYALVERASVVVTNDSAPLHWASGANTPTLAVFCSTVPAFGFGPMADRSAIFESKEPLTCRPCGLHGHKACPQGHFRCGDVDAKSLALTIRKWSAEA
jgi:heptosyltransferase-2